MSQPASSSRLQRLASHIDAMSLRERAMLGLISLLLIWALWQTLLMAPLTAQRKDFSQRVETARLTVGALNQSIQSLAVQRSRDPLAEQRLKLEQLQKQHATLDAGLAQATGGLIDPQQMGSVLEAVLAQQSNLTLISLTSLPAEPLTIASSPAVSNTGPATAGPASASTAAAGPAATAPASPDPAPTPPSLYRHGLRVDVVGHYGDLLAFLTALDALPWEFIWSDLELSVDEQQRSHLSITVKTLSLRQGWLGV